MPELPEVESVRSSLEPRVRRRVVASVKLDRADIVTGETSTRALLQGATIAELRRLGKHLALIADDGRVLVVHLGMSGQLFWLPPYVKPPNEKHVHERWVLRDAKGADAGTMIFRDPRRFGGLWTLADEGALSTHWKDLGPDALGAPARALLAACATSTRPIKAVLLDQSVLAGVGNIYADEACFTARIDPRRRARTIAPAELTRLASAVRSVLKRSVASRGTTRRDYLDGEGREGEFARKLAVYGRGGKPCLRCGEALKTATVAGRTTVWCGRCQPAGGAEAKDAVPPSGTRTPHAKQAKSPRTKLAASPHAKSTRSKA